MAYRPKSYRKFMATGVATAMVATAVAPTALADAHTFPDVEEGIWFESYVAFGVENGLFNGFPDGEFKPYENMTRAEAVSVVLRALEVEFEEEVTDTGFPDVADNTWFSGAIKTAAEQGIVEGFEDGTFRPNDTVTRAELSDMVADAFDFEASEDFDAGFEDVPEAWWTPAINALTEIGIVQGISSDEPVFAPNEPVMRNEAAAIFTRVLDEDSRLVDQEEPEVDVTFAEAGGQVINVIPGVFNLFLESATAEYGDELTLVIGEEELVLAFEEERGGYFLAAVTGFTQDQLNEAIVHGAVHEDDEDEDENGEDENGEDTMTFASIDEDSRDILQVIPGALNITIMTDGPEYGETVTLQVEGKADIVLTYSESRNGYFVAAAQPYTEAEILQSTVVLD